MKFTAKQLVVMGAKRKGDAPPLSRKRGFAGVAPGAMDPSLTRRYGGLVVPMTLSFREGVVLFKDKRAAFIVRFDGLRLISELNRREHHMATYRRKKVQQSIVATAFASTRVREHGFVPPLLITMTRIAPRAIKDGDNAVSAFKHARDQIARVLGVDDGDSRIEWVVEQRKGDAGAYGVEIRIEHKEET
jgi:hypothetical protein